MAGATVIGAVVARHRVVTRSSAKPCASLASRSAVAGAIRIRSAQRASSIWPIEASAALSHNVVRVGSPDSAWKLSGVDEMLGAGGHRHLHLRSGLAQPAHQFQRLVGGNAAADAQQHVLATSICRSATSGKSYRRTGS